MLFPTSSKQVFGNHSDSLIYKKDTTYPTESKMNGTYFKGVNVARAQVVSDADKAG